MKNACDWASRPWGTNSFARKPSVVIGASPGKIGIAVAQQNLRNNLSFCNSPQMGAREAYIQFTPGLITADGEVTDETTEQFSARFHDRVPGLHRSRAHRASQQPMTGDRTNSQAVTALAYVGTRT